MQVHTRAIVVAVLGLLCACGGGGAPGAITTIPQSNPSVNAPAGTVRSVQLGAQPATATLPIVSQITGTLLFPAVDTTATIALSASATAPIGVTPQNNRRVQSGTLTVYEYITCTTPITIVLPNIPAITLQFPATTSLSEKSVHYGISDLNAQGGQVSFDTQGPATIDGQTVSFAEVPTSITFEAGHTYTFVVYATGISTAKAEARKIYVTNFGYNPTYPYFDGYVSTYNANGTASTPTITGLADPVGMAVDTAGKMYIANIACLPDGCFSNISTYTANGGQSTPLISTAGNPLAVAVDAAGNVYVAADDGTVKTYDPNGIAISPTITSGLVNPDGVAVDGAGKIYVANYGVLNGNTYSGSSVVTYQADGTRTTPTITTGLAGPVGVAVDASGKIYVANQGNNTVTTYNRDGTRTSPTLSAGLNSPKNLAVDAAGKIFVVNGNDSVTTYTADGARTTPTITTGLNHAYGIAVR